MLRTVGDQPTLWEAILPEDLRRLPLELARVDVLLDDPVFSSAGTGSTSGYVRPDLAMGGDRCRRALAATLGR
jgi:hypothetical protein